MDMGNGNPHPHISHRPIAGNAMSKHRWPYRGPMPEQEWLLLNRALPIILPLLWGAFAIVLLIFALPFILLWLN
jgi:hypothetical protein